MVGAEQFASGTTTSYKSAIKKLPIIRANQGLRLKARLDHVDEDGDSHQAGDIWQLEGPLTYRPTAQAVSSC